MKLEPLLDEFVHDDNWDRLKEPQHLSYLAAPEGTYGFHIIVDTSDGQVATVSFYDNDTHSEQDFTGFIDRQRREL